MKWLLPAAAICLGLLCTAAAAEEVGEFSIPSVSPLTRKQVDELRRLARRDSEAQEIAQEVAAPARPLLGAVPRPLAVIHYEGLVNTDPRRVATVEKLREMGDVARLMRYWPVSGDPRAAAALQRFIVAWATTYRPDGNDVNENKLYPLLVAYHALRDDFPADQRQAVDAWIADLGRRHARAVENSRHFTNRYSKHVRLLAIIGMILERPDWIAAAREGVRRFVSESLYADGTSNDLKRRDTLTYHASGLRPIIELAMLAGEEGRGLMRGSRRRAARSRSRWTTSSHMRSARRHAASGRTRRSASIAGGRKPVSTSTRPDGCTNRPMHCN